ncbi:unnamed protein product [Amoebophrya sp. A120]|nr:unnamed protein product [Amoebophrya sp. A120]|eukprot:GSA120T00000579001.1
MIDVLVGILVATCQGEASVSLFCFELKRQLQQLVDQVSKL